MRALQELVQARLKTLGISNREAAARSGGLIAHETLRRIAIGETTGRLLPKTVAGLVAALEVSEAEILAAADATARPKRLLELSEDLAALPPEKLDAAIATMEKIIDDHRRSMAVRKSRRPSE